MSDCEFFGGGHGVTVESGGSLFLYHCQFYDLYGVGVILLPSGASVDIEDCDISAGLDAIVSNGVGSTLSITNSTLTGGSRSVIQLIGVDPAFVQYSHLFKGTSEYAVLCDQPEGLGAARHDFRGNYWGTNDGEQIATWILDGHDDPLIRAEVLHAPLATGDPDLVVSLAPQDSTIVIPDTGGTFLYDATIENNTATDIVADLAIEAILPDGTTFPVMTLPAVILSAASVTTRTGVAQSVPSAAPPGTYTYRVTASLGDTLLVDTAELPFEKLGGGVMAAGVMSWPVTGWQDEDRPPLQAGALIPILYGPVPNPFNPVTTVAFELPTQEAVKLHVYDLQGRLVRTLLAGAICRQGRNEVVWDGQDDGGRQAASGTYLLRLEAGGHAETTRAVLVK